MRNNGMTGNDLPSQISTVYAHGCENILSQSYVPATPDDTILFNEQQKFMYDVWINVLRTPMGKHYVRKQQRRFFWSTSLDLPTTFY